MREPRSVVGKGFAGFRVFVPDGLSHFVGLLCTYKLYQLGEAKRERLQGLNTIVTIVRLY